MHSATKVEWRRSLTIPGPRRGLWPRLVQVDDKIGDIAAGEVDALAKPGTDRNGVDRSWQPASGEASVRVHFDRVICRGTRGLIVESNDVPRNVLCDYTARDGAERSSLH